MSTLKISMYLIASKKNQKGLAPVYCRVKHLGKAINLSTDIFIAPGCWNVKKEK